MNGPAINKSTMPTSNPGTNKRKIDSTPAPRNTNPAGKRSRVSRACDQCRTAREKCDGQPTCSTCAASDRACTYTTNPKKRGIQPGYIRTLELALTWLFQNSDAETLLSKKLAREGAASILLERDTKESNKLHKSWRRSKFCRDVDKLLAGEDIGEGNDRLPESDDQDSDADIPARDASASVLPDPTPPAREAPPANVPAISLPVTTRPTETVPLPPERWRLFDIYFAYTHCWFPVCEKHDILKLSYSYPESGLQLSSGMAASGEHAELWAVLALSSLQDGPTSQATGTALDSASSLAPNCIYGIARTLIPSESGAFEVGHVKALLLLALFNIAQGSSEAAWLLLGHASRIMIDLEHKPPSQVSRFKHVFSGCYLLDCIVSMQLGRQPYLQTSDIERIGRVYEDGLEEWQPWTGCFESASGPVGPQSRAPALTLSTFNRLIGLADIMRLTCATNSTPNGLQEAASRLEAWKMSLPPAMEPLLSDRAPAPTTPPALLIQLMYSCSCMAIFSSHSAIQRMLEITGSFQNIGTWPALPPIVDCLMAMSESKLTTSTNGGALQSRVQELRMKLARAWSATIRPSMPNNFESPIGDTRSERSGPTPGHARPSVSSHHDLPTPTSNHAPAIHMRTNSTAMHHIAQPISPNTITHPPPAMAYNSAPAQRDFQSPYFDGAMPPMMGSEQWNSSGARNVESFFDELASLDGAERMENQPQFMQNLGFAPDADIADLLTTDFGQLPSLLPQYVQPDFQEPQQMNGTHFFDGT